MADLHSLPYVEAHFDKTGAALNNVSVSDTTTDLFVISHGWRNKYEEATKLYSDFFGHFADPAVVPPALLSGHACAMVGVFWPSTNFDFLIAAQDTNQSANTAALNEIPSDEASRQKVKDRLEALKAPEAFGDQKALSDAQKLVDNMDGKHTVQAEFIGCLRSLMDAHAVNDEDGSDIFYKKDPNLVFDRLNIHPHAVDARIPRVGKAAALSPTTTAVPPTGHATGLVDAFKGFTASATNAVSYLTYYMMKARAGDVGTKGVAPLIDRLAGGLKAGARIHLIGHSFGGRLVTAAAMASKTDKLYSMSLLQAAFSHNGFSPTALMDGFFRAVVDQHRIERAVIATHTQNDTAVGIAYPLASRLAGTTAAALGDENDKYGGIGRNGAQQMNAGEVIKGNLLGVGGAYVFTPGKIHNLNADAFIKSHGDVTGEEVVSAVAAVALQKTGS